MTKNITTKDAAIIIEDLINYAIDNIHLKLEDVIYVRNQLLDLLQLPERAFKTGNKYGDLQTEMLDPLIDYAISNEIIKDIDAILFETRIMGILTPAPSQIIADFDRESAEGIEKATTDFYKLCVANNYLRMVDINKNMEWSHEGSLGDITVTINLSKPEKDPKEVLAAANAPATTYPSCKLCPDNVGFAGNYNWPARQTLRTIPLYLNEELWHYQYSPYSYFKEHMIALSDEHRPMVVDINAIKRQLDFVEIFPHYFIGSNAALPIVGGSILAHDHYQGGAKVLPMFKAENLKSFKHPRYQDVTISIVNWYNSVVRFESTNRKQLEKVTEFFIDFWYKYSDESVELISKTKAQHNAITPITRFENNTYVCDFILRNNRTDNERPFGIFHPSEDLHHIKKESIGLIEAMGTFILPGRLYKESQQIQEYLTGVNKIDFKEISNPDNPLSKHMGMIAQLAQTNKVHEKPLSSGKASEVIMDFINETCEKILECTAIFKHNEIGQRAFVDMLVASGLEEINE